MDDHPKDSNPPFAAEDIQAFLRACQTSQQDAQNAEEFDRNEWPLIETSLRLFGPQTQWTPTFDESQRQLVLLALHKLRQERPGWDYAIGEIEKHLGGQLDWPE